MSPEEFIIFLGAGRSATTLDPATNPNSTHSLSANLLTVTGLGPTGLSRSVASYASGTHSFRFTVGQVNNTAVGLCLSTVVNNEFVGQTSNSIGVGYNMPGWIINGSFTGTSDAPLVNGHTYEMAADLNNRKAWMRDLTTGGFWNANASADPTTNSLGQSIMASGAVQVAVTAAAVGDSVTFDFANPNRPSGYTCW